MTTALERPTNGHSVDTDPVTTQPIEPDPPEAAGQAPPEAGAGEYPAVAYLRQRLANRTTERDLAREFTAVDGDDVFDEVRSVEEQAADRQVAEKVRKKRRAERRRAGKAAVRDERRQRLQESWMARAERARQRLLDPAKSLATDHRRWVFSSVALFALLAGGVAFMSRTVHHGLVGESGTWLAYLVEPLASVLLIVSLLAQFTGRQRDIPVPRGVVWFDVSLAVASLLLNTVPWGLRYGFDAGSLTAHILVPALIVASVIGWHIASRIYGDALATSRADGAQDETLVDRLGLLRQAVRSGDLAVDASATQVIKYLRNNLPGGIGHDAARRIARSFLGY